MAQANTSKTMIPALIVFGQTDKGGKHAAWFSADESAAAKRAANLRSLTVLEPVPASLNGSLAKVPRGRFIVGQISLSKVTPELFAALLECTRGVEKENAQAEGPGTGAAIDTSNQASAGPAPAGQAQVDAARVPEADLWRQIQIGDVVLAEYSKEDGWWPARVVAIAGDLIQMTWCDGTGPWREVRSKIGLLPKKA